MQAEALVASEHTYGMWAEASWSSRASSAGDKCHRPGSGGWGLIHSNPKINQGRGAVAAVGGIARVYAGTVGLAPKQESGYAWRVTQACWATRVPVGQLLG